MYAKIIAYFFAFIFANFIVLFFGSWGLVFTALFLVPFDFVMRCYFHESWQGWELFFKMGALVAVSSIATFLINISALNIAAASCCGFIAAQACASVFYQLTIKRSYFVKVNGSDIVAIIADSIVFQIVAFSVFDFTVFLSQFVLKTIGGFFWYWVLFSKKDEQKKDANL
jgi:hypothetical protein